MPLKWQLWDRVRAFMRQAQIYRTDNLYQDQETIDKIIYGGQFLDFSKQSALFEQTNLQINRLERYKDYDMMDEVGEISLALDMYADESTLIDPERKHSIIVKAKRKGLKKIIEDLLYNTLMLDREIRPLVRYLCKYGDFVSEIIPNKNRDGVASFKFMNVYNFTRVQTKYGDLVGFYFQDAGLAEPQFLHPWQVMHLRLTSYEVIYHPYGRCGALCSTVQMPTGYKLLKDIQKGDQVYSFDLKTLKPVITTVLDKVINGKKQTVIIKTKHRSIQVTPEHPMLAVIKNNYVCEEQICKGTERNKPHVKKQHKRDIKTKQYILAKDLVKGDKLVLPKFHNVGIDIPIETYKIADQYDGKRMRFPQYITEDFARLMGFLIGDGWVPNGGRTLCFAEGEYQELNNKYINIIKLFDYEGEPYRHTLKDKDGQEKKYGYFTFRSTELSQTIVNMGLVGKCYEKRIPKWVFVATDEIKKAFIEGLVDSDGSTNIDEWGCERYQIELTSEELVKDLKVLLDQMNIKCGNISKRNRPIMTTVIHGEEYERRDSWIVYWYDAKMPSGDLMHMGNRRTKYDNSSEDYLVESILSIEDGGEVEVGDIQVSEHHNFVADGVVIHNSILDGGRKDFKRLRLMEDAALVYRLTRAPEKRVFSIPVGNIPPKEVPQYIELLARQMKKHKFVDPATGQVNERYSPLIQDDDFWLPKRADGTGPTIDTLPGAENLDQIADIEYFKKKMVAGLKIPFSRVGIGEPAEANGRSLASVSPDFAKAIQWVQREVVMGIKKIVLIHLSLRGHPVDDLESFDLSMTAASAIDELYRIETWNTRSDIMKNLKELGFFPDEWIVERFTDMTPDEISAMKKQKGYADPDDLKAEDALNDEERNLILEYNNLRPSRELQIDEPSIIFTPKFYVNSKELDGLKGKDGKFIVESSVNQEDVNAVKEETRTLLMEETGPKSTEVDGVVKQMDDVPAKE
jgi:intein/homing endonuclease